MSSLAYFLRFTFDVPLAILSLRFSSSLDKVSNLIALHFDSGFLEHLEKLVKHLLLEFDARTSWIFVFGFGQHFEGFIAVGVSQQHEVLCLLPHLVVLGQDRDRIVR